MGALRSRRRDAGELGEILEEQKLEGCRGRDAGPHGDEAGPQRQGALLSGDLHEGVRDVVVDLGPVRRPAGRRDIQKSMRWKRETSVASAVSKPN